MGALKESNMINSALNSNGALNDPNAPMMLNGEGSLIATLNN